MSRRLYVRYMPRTAFVDFHARTQRWAVLVAHRRSGKTTSVLADAVKRALEGPANGRYAYIAPYYAQAKTIAWDLLCGLTEDVLVKRTESELRVDLINGSRIRLFGGDNPDALRGPGLDGAMLDEYADAKGNLFEEIIRPSLADRGGWAVFAGTPKGVGKFRDLYEMAAHNPDWYTAYLPVSKTGLLSRDELADAAALMSPEVYAQEFECSWVAPRSGSFYGELVQEAEDRGRVGEYPYDPDQPVFTSWDIGWRDSTAIWYWQPRPDGFAVIDHDEAAGRTVDDWVELLKSKGYEYDLCWLPHDARAKSLQTGRSTLEQIMGHKFKCRIAPQLSVQQGIDAVRVVLPKCYFNKSTTAVGLRRLRQYARNWNEKSGAFSNDPKHDENSHSADAFRYGALTMRETVGSLYKLGVPVARPIDKSFQLEVLWHDRDDEKRFERQRI